MGGGRIIVTSLKPLRRRKLRVTLAHAVRRPPEPFANRESSTRAVPPIAFDGGRKNHEAAAISCRHPKWDERPLLVVVKKPGAEITKEELLGFFEGRIAKWQIPDDAVFVAEIPHTATGKTQKLKLREQFKDYKLPTA